MAPKRTKAAAHKPAAAAGPPAPFKPAPADLALLTDALSPDSMYVMHVDTRPRAFKRKIFAVPVAMNVAVAALFVWRACYIFPWYWQLLESMLGSHNETTLIAEELMWSELVAEIMRRSLQFMLDLCLAIFVWPWPYEFTVGGAHGSPVQWRFNVGFRDTEIYVRRSRVWYEKARTGGFTDEHGAGSATPATPATSGAAGAAPKPPKTVDLLASPEFRRALLTYTAQATSPALLENKTGYLTMDRNWDLDWDLMSYVTHLVDNKDLALDAIRNLVIFHHDVHGWVVVDVHSLGGRPGSASGPGSALEDTRRRQVFAFRDALSAIGREDLFFRWIEIIQFEASKPGGMGDEEKQVAIAKQVRDLFLEKGVDFDELWKQAVGTDTSMGL